VSVLKDLVAEATAIETEVGDFCQRAALALHVHTSDQDLLEDDPGVQLAVKLVDIADQLRDTAVGVSENEPAPGTPR
jgi:hypothetical protein